nr:hypothetical protein [uncultured bacterium]
MMGTRIFLAAAVVAAMGLAGCNTMKSLTGGSPTSGSGGYTQSVTLRGANEVPPVNSSATGTGNVTVGADGSVTANITVTGMTPTAAHIHEAAAGANGPVIVPFVKQGDSTFVAAPGAKMTEAQLAAFKAGRTYVNVHSAAHASGEIRAQLKGN